MKLVLAGILMMMTLADCSGPTEAPKPKPAALPQLRAGRANIVDDKGQPVILRGCNFGNWLLLEMWMMEMWRDGDPKDHWQTVELLKQRFGPAEADRLMEVYRENWIRQRDFDAMKSWGFNVVRVPFYYELIENDFKWLDRAVEMATTAGVYVIIDMHGAPGGQSVDQCAGHSGLNKLWQPENRKHAALLWKKIAERYRDNPTVAAYDLLNEPYGNYGNEPPDATIVATMDELIHSIREVDTNHLILCAGSLRGAGIYGAPADHGWQNVGYTEHFYPGLFGGDPTLDTHARFIGRDLPSKAELWKKWNVPFLAGEFNVVFDRAGGAAMMRRYYDVYASNGWAATMWSYKIVKQKAGSHPDNWYMVTNREELKIPRFRTDSKDDIENFFRATGTMDYAQDEELQAALTTNVAPALALKEFPVIAGPAPQDAPPAGWEAVDIGKPEVTGGQRVLGEELIELYGAGRDVWEGNDECRYLWRPAGNRFDISTSLKPPMDTHVYAKAGLMYRASLAADAPIVILCLNPDGTCTFGYRQKPGERIVENRIAGPGKTEILRLVRRGAAFEATALDKDSNVIATQAADMPGLAAVKGHIGCFVLSHEAMLLSKTTFGNLKLE